MVSEYPKVSSDSMYWVLFSADLRREILVVATIRC